MREKRESGETSWGGGGGRIAGVSSRTGEITHFDGIKMSVFPSPICGQIARNRAARAAEEKGEDACLLSFLTQTILAGVAFLPSRVREREKDTETERERRRKRKDAVSIDYERFFGRRPGCDPSSCFLEGG